MTTNLESVPNQETTIDGTISPWGEVKNVPFNGGEATEKGEDLRLKGYEKTLSLLRPLSEKAAKNFEITTESRAFRLGGAALRLFNANQAKKISDFMTVRLDDIRGMFSKKSERGFRLFFQDRYKQNVQQLKQCFDEDAAATMVGAYSDLMNDFPELRNVRIDASWQEDKKGARAFYAKDVSGRILPTVQLESSAIYSVTDMAIKIPEAEYDRRREFYDKSGFVFDGVQNVAIHKQDANMTNIINAVAKKLEIDPAKLAQDRKLLGAIIMAHEFGHHLDFRRNYFGVAMDKAGEDSNFGTILQTAFNLQARDKETDLGTTWFQMMNEERFRERRKKKMTDGEIMQQLRMSQEDYREQMHEKIADTFAIDFVKKYAQKYGFELPANKDI